MILNDAQRRILEATSTASLTTLLLGKGIRNSWMRGPMPLNSGQKRLVGPAYTVRFVPLREDLATAESWYAEHSIRSAIEAMPEGVVVVIDARGIRDAAPVGDIFCARLLKRGVLGLVSDGGVRDIVGIEQVGLPIWCSGVTAPPVLSGLTFADTGQAIGCGGVAVFQGDIIVADRDGAVVIPAAMVSDICAGAEGKDAMESWILAEVLAGKAMPGLYPPEDEARARYEAFKKKWLNSR